MTQLDLFTDAKRPPLLPHVASCTSEAAAESMRLPAASLREEARLAFLAAGTAGLTDEELFRWLRQYHPAVKESTVRARRVELVKSGDVAELFGRFREGSSGRQMQVWVATTE